MSETDLPLRVGSTGVSFSVQSAEAEPNASPALANLSLPDFGCRLRRASGSEKVSSSRMKCRHIQSIISGQFSTL